MTSTRRLRLIAVAVSILLWAASMAMPAVELQKVHSEFRDGYTHKIPGELDVNRGLQMLGYSIFGPLELNFAGVANPLAITGWILLVLWKPRPETVVAQWEPPSQERPWTRAISLTMPGRYRPVTAGVVLGIALVLTLQTLQLHSLPIEYDESGSNEGYLNALLPGWYAWALSIALPFAVSLLRAQPQTEVADAELVSSGADLPPSGL